MNRHRAGAIRALVVLAVLCLGVIWARHSHSSAEGVASAGRGTPWGSVEGRVSVHGRRKRVRGAVNPYAAAFDALDARQAPPAHLIVYLEDDLGRVAPRSRPEPLDQENRNFSADMVPIVAGESVSFTNRDGACHSLFGFSELKEFRLGRRNPGESACVKFSKAPSSGLGVIDVFCEIHPEERAYILILPNAHWALVPEREAFQEGGAPFKLEGLPPRTYTLTSWHPGLQSMPVKVTVKAGQVARADIVMKGDGL